jgi:hypothetical protein
MGASASCILINESVETHEQKFSTALAGNDLRANNIRRKSWKYILSLHDPPSGQFGLKIFYRYYEANYSRLPEHEKYDPYLCCPVSTLTKEDSRKMNSILFIVRQLLDVNGICCEV